MPPSLLTYYTLRRNGTIPQKAYEDWGPESKRRELFLTEIETKTVNKEMLGKFREVDWNPEDGLGEGREEELSPLGGKRVDVGVWKGEGDLVIERGGRREGKGERVEGMDLNAEGGWDLDEETAKGKAERRQKRREDVKKKAGWENEWTAW